MGFFDKLKESASKAADKAKDSVEVVRLNSQISTKHGEIEKLYVQIGKTVFEANVDGNLSSTEELIQSFTDSIIAIKQEIELLKGKIKVIKEEKDCVCGQVLPLEAMFCSSCGHKFEEARGEPAVEMIKVIEAAPVEVVAPEETIIDSAPIGNEETSATSKTCSSCEELLGDSDRFCENCGTPVQ